MRRRDDGVTLIEVLITVAILGVIIGPLTAAMIVYIRNTNSVGRRLSESHDAQISSAYLAQDVQSIGVRDWTAYPYPLKQSIELNAPAAGGLYPCGAAGTPNAVVRFAWDNPKTASAAPEYVRVAYVVRTVGPERQLQRITCTNAGTSTLVLAHNLDQTATDPVLVACSSVCTAAPAVPLVVTLTITIRDPSDSGSPLTVTLRGQRRQT